MLVSEKDMKTICAWCEKAPIKHTFIQYKDKGNICRSCSAYYTKISKMDAEKSRQEKLHILLEDKDKYEGMLKNNQLVFQEIKHDRLVKVKVHNRLHRVYKLLKKYEKEINQLHQTQ